MPIKYNVGNPCAQSSSTIQYIEHPCTIVLDNCLNIQESSVAYYNEDKHWTHLPICEAISTCSITSLKDVKFNTVPVSNQVLAYNVDSECWTPHLLTDSLTAIDVCDALMGCKLDQIGDVCHTSIAEESLLVWIPGMNKWVSKSITFAINAVSIVNRSCLNDLKDVCVGNLSNTEDYILYKPKTNPTKWQATNLCSLMKATCNIDDLQNVCIDSNLNVNQRLIYNVCINKWINVPDVNRVMSLENVDDVCYVNKDSCNKINAKDNVLYWNPVKCKWENRALSLITNTCVCLNQLKDVAILPPQNCDILYWNNVSRLWTPSQIHTLVNKCNINILNDVCIEEPPMIGDVLTYDGCGKWINRQPQTDILGCSGGGNYFNCNDLSACSINHLGDVSIGACIPSDSILCYNGRAWVPQSIYKLTSNVPINCYQLCDCSITNLGDVSYATNAQVGDILCLEVSPTTGQFFVTTKSSITPFDCSNLNCCSMQSLYDVEYNNNIEPSQGDILCWTSTGCGMGKWTNVGISSLKFNIDIDMTELLSQCNIEKLANVSDTKTTDTTTIDDCVLVKNNTTGNWEPKNVKDFLYEQLSIYPGIKELMDNSLVLELTT